MDMKRRPLVCDVKVVLAGFGIFMSLTAFAAVADAADICEPTSQAVQACRPDTALKGHDNETATSPEKKNSCRQSPSGSVTIHMVIPTKPESSPAPKVLNTNY